MKKLILISIFAIIAYYGYSQTEITAFNSSSLSTITRVAKGNDNSLYLTGYFSGTWTVNTKTYSKETGSSQFICKMDATGKISWFIQSDATILDMEFFDNNLYLLCQYKSSVEFLSSTKTSGKYNIFVCSVSSDGTLNWLTGPENNSDAIFGDGITLDPQGNVYMLGSYDNSIIIDGKSLSKKDDKNAFITKFDKTGKIQWLSQMTGGDSYITGLWPSAICYNDSDHVYVTGYLLGPCTFGTKSLTTKTYKFPEGELYSSSVFVATYDDKGVCIDVKSFVTEASVNQIKTDKSGNIILAGYFKGNITDVDYATSYFGTEKVKSTIDPYMQGPSEDSYIAKYTSSGQLLWVARGLGSSTDRILSCVVGVDGSIYACGFYEIDMGFSGKTKKSEIVQTTGTTEEKYKPNIFVIKLSADGELEWFKSGGGTGSDTAEDIISDTSGVTVVGSMSGNIVFDNVSKQIGGKFRNGVIIKI